MKNKTFTKKLVLNKNTIANLGNKEMREILGGELTVDQTICVTNCVCPSIRPSKCPQEC